MRARRETETANESSVYERDNIIFNCFFCHKNINPKQKERSVFLSSKKTRAKKRKRIPQFTPLRLRRERDIFVFSLVLSLSLALSLCTYCPFRNSLSLSLSIYIYIRVLVSILHSHHKVLKKRDLLYHTHQSGKRDLDWIERKKSFGVVFGKERKVKRKFLKQNAQIGE